MKVAKQHAKMMELEKAIEDYSAAIKVNPNNYLTYQLRSEVRRDLNLLPEGIADFDSRHLFESQGCRSVA